MIDEELEEWAQKCQKCKYLKVDKLDPDTFYCSYKGVKDCNFKPRKQPRKPPEKPLMIDENNVGIPIKWQR